MKTSFPKGGHRSWGCWSRNPGASWPTVYQEEICLGPRDLSLRLVRNFPLGQRGNIPPVKPDTAPPRSEVASWTVFPSPDNKPLAASASVAVFIKAGILKDGRVSPGDSVSKISGASQSKSKENRDRRKSYVPLGTFVELVNISASTGPTTESSQLQSAISIFRAVSIHVLHYPTIRSHGH